MALFLAISPSARAALYDEIQVYDDAINKVGEFGLELHANTTPSGRGTPDYPGEFVPVHGQRLTPEFSYGVSETLEAGLYLPLLKDPTDGLQFAGPKLRLKWIPYHPGEGESDWFYGLNGELAYVGSRFEPSREGFELRPIIGYRSPEWLVVGNPVLAFDLSPGFRGGGPDFSPSLKVTRHVTRGLEAGFEYYRDLGKLWNIAPSAEQQQTVYAVIDVERAPWIFNLGIGRGLNAATDRWTVKAIFEIPL